MYAFRRAVEVHHTDMLELDVRSTADGEVVVVHDATLERCTDGEGPIEGRTFAELQALDAAFHFTPAGATGTPLRGAGVRVPRLVEVLDTFPGLRLNVEVKSRSALEPFVRLLVTRPQELSRLCLGSEHDEVAQALAAALPDACLFYPANALAALLMSLNTDEVQDDPRYTVLDMPLVWEGVSLFDVAVAELAQARGKWVNVWTVDEAPAMREAIARGVGGIMTDRPDVLRAVLDAR